MGDSPRENQRQAGPFTLPSIATMTRGIGKEESPKQKVHADMMRDSGMWSMQSPSKHSSTISNATGLSNTSSNTGLHLHTILNSDDSHRFSGASGGTPSARYSRDPPTSQPPAQSYENNRASIDANNTSFLDSRRSSIDSRVGVNIGHLSVNTNSSNHAQSPYESTNPSQVSLASSNLPHGRAMAPPIPPPKSSGSILSPHSRRPVTAGGQPPRRAPPISANPRAGGMPNPMAAAPTKGFAWAFPDEPGKEEQGESMSPESSRQGSLAASSINTLESTPWAMKHGDDAYGHSMQHKAVTSLQAGDLAQIGTGNYSRTPELRVSHKLAERKRRSEMKDLFDSLNRILPHPSGNKASKWEVLSKAVDYITSLKGAYEQNQRDTEKLRSELEHARAAVDENHVMHNEITAMYQQLCRVDPNGHHVFGPRSQFLDQQSSQTPGRLAPMQSPGGFSAMQGVEYNHGYDRR